MTDPKEKMPSIERDPTKKGPAKKDSVNHEEPVDAVSDSFKSLDLRNTVSSLHLLAHEATVHSVSPKKDSPAHPKFGDLPTRVLGNGKRTENPVASNAPGGAESPPPANAPVDFEEVQTVASFRLMEELGEGGMGLVYRAKQAFFDRDVAVKRLHPFLVHMDKIKEGFVNEAVITGQLGHPNIPPVYGLDVKPESLSMVMKLIDGCTLAELLDPKTKTHEETAKKYPFEKQIELLIAVCNPIRLAHSHGLIHRDLKPANIMIGQFGEILLMDWGLVATVRKDMTNPISRSASHVSNISGPEGTWSYAPPEIMDGFGELLGYHTDIYLLGAILYELINGFPPHYERLERKFTTKEERDYIPSLDYRFDDEIRSICLTALAPRPEDRYPSVLEFQQALEAYLTHRASHATYSDAQRLVDKAKQKLDVDEIGPPDEIYNLLQEAVFGFKQSLALWSENDAAEFAQRNTKLILCRTAFSHDDFGLAAAQLNGLQGKEVETLSKQIEEGRKKELAAHHARTSMKRILVAFLAIVLTASLAGTLFFRGMGRTAATSAEQIEEQLVREGKQELHRIVVNAAREMALRKQLLATSLLAFSQLVGEQKAATDEMPDGKPSPDDDATPVLAPNRQTSSTTQKLTFSGDRLKALRLENKTSIKRYFAGFQQSQQFVEYPSTDSTPEPFIADQNPWYAEAIENEGITFTTGFADKTRQQMILTATCPIFDPNGNAVGVAGTSAGINDVLDGIQLKHHWKQTSRVEISKINVRNKSFNVLFSNASNNKGGPVASTQPPTEIPVAKSKFASLTAAITGGKSGVTEMERDGIQTYAGYAPIASSRAFLLITIEHQSMTRLATKVKTSIIDDVNTSLVEMAQMVAILFFLVIVGILLITRKIH